MEKDFPTLPVDASNDWGVDLENRSISDRAISISSRQTSERTSLNIIRENLEPNVDAVIFSEPRASLDF